jgi:hypothetical protein
MGLRGLRVAKDLLAETLQGAAVVARAWPAAWWVQDEPAPPTPRSPAQLRGSRDRRHTFGIDAAAFALAVGAPSGPGARAHRKQSE